MDNKSKIKERIIQNANAEKEWHEQKFYIDSGHWTSHPAFASRERHWLINHVQENRFYGYLSKYIKNKTYGRNAKVLFAPVGDGSHVHYLQGISNETHGIDLSAVALAKCPSSLILKEEDILCSGYAEETFDVVICAQFFHHVHSVGFKPFIIEFQRILKKGGTLAVLEPSILYPFSWVSALARKIIGNVTGLVEGERPVNPFEILGLLKSEGFANIKTIGLTFNHVRFPCAVQHLVSLIDFILRYVTPLKYYSNSIGWFCEKK